MALCTGFIEIQSSLYNDFPNQQQRHPHMNRPQHPDQESTHARFYAGLRIKLHLGRVERSGRPRSVLASQRRGDLFFGMSIEAPKRQDESHVSSVVIIHQHIPSDSKSDHLSSSVDPPDIVTISPSIDNSRSPDTVIAKVCHIHNPLAIYRHSCRAMHMRWRSHFTSD